MLYPIAGVRYFATGLDHPEGVAVGADGQVYAGGEAGQIYRISPDGRKVETIANTGGSCLGVALDLDENLYFCDCRRRAVLRVSQKGKTEVFTNSAEGRPFIQPNFPVFDAQGNLYFSDSGDWKQTNGIIYKASPDGTTKTFAPGPFHFANGLALDADERYLYVIESNLDRVLRIVILPDGTAGAPEMFADGLVSVPDGMAFDQAGNLYVTTYGSSGIYRVSCDRNLELLCQDIENELLCLVTNAAFGGPAFDQLIVANLGHHHLSILDLTIKGQALWHHRNRQA